MNTLEKLQERFGKELRRAKTWDEKFNVKARYQVFFILAELERIQNSPTRFWVIPVNEEPGPGSHMVDLVTDSREKAIELAEKMALQSKISWRLYEGQKAIMIIPDDKTLDQIDLLLPVNWMEEVKCASTRK